MTLRDAHRPAAPAELRNDQCQERELQERAILPSDFEDASLTEQSWPTIPAVTHVIEALGSEIHVIFVIDAPPVEHKDVADLGQQGEEDESGIPLYEGKSLWTARVNARSSVRAGDRIDLGVDTRNMHFFDPDSGLAIGDKQAAEPRRCEHGFPQAGVIAPAVAGQ